MPNTFQFAGIIDAKYKEFQILNQSFIDELVEKQVLILGEKKENFIHDDLSESDLFGINEVLFSETNFLSGRICINDRLYYLNKLIIDEIYNGLKGFFEHNEYIPNKRDEIKLTLLGILNPDEKIKFLEESFKVHHQIYRYDGTLINYINDKQGLEDEIKDRIKDSHILIRHHLTLGSYDFTTIRLIKEQMQEYGEDDIIISDFADFCEWNLIREFCLCEIDKIKNQKNYTDKKNLNKPKSMPPFKLVYFIDFMRNVINDFSQSPREKQIFLLNYITGGDNFDIDNQLAELTHLFNLNGTEFEELVNNQSEYSKSLFKILRKSDRNLRKAISEVYAIKVKKEDESKLTPNDRKINETYEKTQLKLKKFNKEFEVFLNELGSF